MKAIITLILLVLCVSTVFAAGGVRVNGDLTLSKDAADPFRVLFFSNGTSQYSGQPWGYNNLDLYYMGGNVGIGKFAPSSALDVNGTVTATGFSGNGSGLTNVTSTVINGVYTTGSYADPAWITSLAGSKITGNISGNAATASSLAINPPNCSAGSLAAGVAADGSAEGCMSTSSLNTASSLVQRDASGNFSAGSISVGGVTNSGNYGYASAQTRYLNLSAAAFLPDTNSTAFATYYSPNRKYVTTAGTASRLIAPVNLPVNAVLKEWKCKVLDISATYNMNMVLYKVDFTSLIESALVGIFSSSGSPVVAEITSGVRTVAVDQNALYYLQVYPDDGTCGQNCQLYGCQVRYEVNSAD